MLFTSVDGITPNLPIVIQVYLALTVVSTVFSIAWYKIVIFLMVYHVFIIPWSLLFFIFLGIHKPNSTKKTKANGGFFPCWS